MTGGLYVPDVCLYVSGHVLPLHTYSLLLYEVSPYLTSLLSTVSLCDGCQAVRTIVLVDVERSILQTLLDILHSKYFHWSKDDENCEDEEGG